MENKALSSILFLDYDSKGGSGFATSLLDFTTPWTGTLDQRHAIFEGQAHFPSLTTTTPPSGWNNAKITPEPPMSQVIALKTVQKILPGKTFVMTRDSRQGSEAATLGSKRLIKEINGAFTHAVRFQSLWDLSNKP